MYWTYPIPRVKLFKFSQQSNTYTNYKPNFAKVIGNKIKLFI